MGELVRFEQKRTGVTEPDAWFWLKMLLIALLILVVTKGSLQYLISDKNTQHMVTTVVWLSALLFLRWKQKNSAKSTDI